MVFTNELLFVGIAVVIIVILVVLFKRNNSIPPSSNEDIEGKINDLKKTMESNFEAILHKSLVNSTDYIQSSSQRTLANCLRPLMDEMKSYESKIEKMVKEESVDREVMKHMINSVSQAHLQFSDEAKKFTTSIRGSSQFLGRWGESSCENLLTGSGYTVNDFLTQKEFVTKSGNTVKPDFLVKIPGGRGVAIDSKLSLNSFMSYLEETDESLKEKHLASLVDNIKKHYNDLAKKKYHEIQEVQCIEFTVLYLASDMVLWYVIKKDNEILRDALSKNILICTPVNLMALLKIIDGLTFRHKQAENLKEVIGIASKLFEKLSYFTQKLSDTQDHLDKSSKSLKTAINHLTVGEKSIINESRKLKEIGIGNGKEITFPVVDDDEEKVKK